MLPLTLQTEAEAQRGFADLRSLVESRGGSVPWEEAPAALRAPPSQALSLVLLFLQLVRTCRKPL